MVLKLSADANRRFAVLDGYADTDWATDEEFRKSQTSMKIEAEGAPLYSKSGLQTPHAGASGIAVYYGGCSTAEVLTT